MGFQLFLQCQCISQQRDVQAEGGNTEYISEEIPGLHLEILSIQMIVEIIKTKEMVQAGYIG